MSEIAVPSLSKQVGTILGPDGEVVSIPSYEFSLPDVELLRQYKKFLLRQGLREALYCNQCFGGDRSDGCEAHVTDADVMIKCRCKLRFYKGQTY